MLTLTQLSELGKIKDIDIYSGLALPADSPLDRDVLINSIIMKCGLNYPLYADPAVMQSAITVWSSKHQYTFEHVAKIYVASYSPIENYDRYEDTTTDRSRNMTDNTTGSNSKNESISSSTSGSDTQTHSGTDTTTETVETSAYNASTYQPDSKTTTGLLHGEQVQDYSSSTGSSTKGTTGSNTVNKTVNEGETTTNTGHMRGNIGISTAMSMELEEYSFLDKYNPYDFLASVFENELTLFIY